VGRRVVEFGTTGIDEALQGLTSNPYPLGGTPSYLGLRVPAFVSVDRFLFCLATFSTSRGGRIRGLRQGLKIGMDTNAGGLPQRPLEMWVTTPDFRFQNGDVSWHLVKEPAQALVSKIPATDTQNWAYLQSQGPAMLYKTFTNSNVTATGQPVLYDQGLTAYTPPDVATTWIPIGGLGTFYELRFPWNNAHAWTSVDIPIGKGKYSFYASILQSDPTTRQNAAYPAIPSPPSANANLGFGCSFPEEAFVANMVQGEDNVSPVAYWRVMGSIIFEDEEG
jgi:hypothetical protein